MGRLAEIDAELHELPDYEKGIRAERERIIALLHDYGTMNYISESTYHELVALITDSVY
jgi:hypothetical protein